MVGKGVNKIITENDTYMGLETTQKVAVGVELSNKKLFSR